jgi:ABC-type glycerol-3-phosphate transport system substrate-binding protein
MKYMKNKIKILFALLAIAAVPFFSGCGSSSSSYLVKLEIWGPYDDSIAYTSIIEQYKKINPYVGEIKYKKFSPDTYKQELMDALASGQGPDIFLINNSWFPSFENKIYPAPAPFVSEQDMKNNFPDVVSSDFMDEGKVYAVPLSVDSMQLYYNRDMFNAAGIVSAPKTWDEFQSDVAKLTIIDSSGNIVRSGTALGTTQNVNSATDILSMLMFQSGLEMPTKKGMSVKFDEGVVTSKGTVTQAGDQVLGFYTQFARLSNSNNIRNPFYTWNSKQANSVDAFAGGTVAMMLNYSWQNSTIKSKNPKLNYAIASIPQIYSDNPATVANYWGYAVSLNKNSSAESDASTASSQTTQSQVTNDMRTHEAWQFLRFMTLKNSGTITLYNAVTKNSKDFAINFDPALDYLKRTQQPAARRDIIDMQKSDAALGPFATGNLIAKHWYQSNPDAVDAIFSNMVDSVVNGGVSLHEALTLARNRVNRL